MRDPRALPAALLLVLSACDGAIFSPVQRGPDGAPPFGGGADSPTPVRQPMTAGGAFHESLGLRRLTRFEYANTVRDLLEVEGVEALLTEDARPAAFSNNAHGLKVSLGQVEALGLAAEQLSALAVPKLTLPSGCALATFDAACLTRFLRPFLTRAYRRPPTEEQVQRLTALFTSLSQTATKPEALRGVLEAVLASPSFLYRSEQLDTLDAFEVASRLSYLVWASAPDSALLDAAAAGDLATPSGRTRALERLWSDPRSSRGLMHFTAEWLGVDARSLARKNDDVRRGAPASLEADLETELVLLFERQLLDRQGTLEKFLAGDTTFVTPALATYYGLPAVTGSVQAVSLAGTARRGALTSGLVIASHAKESGFSVPQLGKFLRQQVLCQQVPAPPPNASIEKPEAVPGQTYRQAFTQLTEGRDSCKACHHFLNPPGFAFLAFDPLGRHLSTDVEGRPFDTASDFPLLDGQTVQVKDAADLAEQLAKSIRARDCLSRMAVEYAFGRSLAVEDLPTYEAVALAQRANGTNLYTVVERLVASDAFTQRGPTR